MKVNLRKLSVVLPLCAAFVGIATTASAAPESPEITAQSKAEALKVFANLAKAAQSGASGLTQVSLLYAPNIVIAGEGRKTTVGLEAANNDEDDFHTNVLGPNSSCGPVTIDEPIVATTSTLSAFLHMTCQTPAHTERPVTHMRMLYVWNKLPEGWRCVMEYWGVEPD